MAAASGRPRHHRRAGLGEVDGDADERRLGRGHLPQVPFLRALPSRLGGTGVGEEALDGAAEAIGTVVVVDCAVPRHGPEATVGGVPDDCLFCKILAGDVPSAKVAENERAYAFRDINPAMPTHVLVIPRAHVANAHELRAEHGEDLAAMYLLAQEVATSEGLAERGYRLVFNVGDDSGNTVAHLHLHVLGGRRMGWPPG